MNSWLRRIFSRPVAMEVSSLRRENVDSDNSNGATRGMQESVLWYVSYSRNDAEKSTLGLVRILRVSGKYKIWIDMNLESGTESWKKGIAKAIDQCPLFLLVITHDVHESKYIGEEIAYSERVEKDRLYVKFKETHLPFGISNMQGLRDNLTFKDKFGEMLAAVKEELDRRKIPRI